MQKIQSITSKWKHIVYNCTKNGHDMNLTPLGESLLSADLFV